MTHPLSFFLICTLFHLSTSFPHSELAERHETIAEWIHQTELTWESKDFPPWILPGTLMNNRYRTIQQLGEGGWAQVHKAHDELKNQTVAIKLFFTIDSADAAVYELDMLTKFAQEADARHLVKLRDTFNYGYYICLVWDYYPLTLWKFTRTTFGEWIETPNITEPCPRLNLSNIQIATRHLFTALEYIHRWNRTESGLIEYPIIHGDLKLENVMISNQPEKFNTTDYFSLMVIDFGSSVLDNENKPSRHVTTPFTRAPEILLEIEYGIPIDIWAAGCLIVQMYGKHPRFRVFDGSVEFLKYMELFGPPPQHMIKASKKRAAWFYKDKQNNYYPLQEPDPIEDMKEILWTCEGRDDNDEGFLKLTDLLGRIFVMDPAERITSKEVLQHPFLTHKF